jgi:large subunit ribosomal protein L34e
MPRPSLRSRSFRRVKVNTPSGSAKVHYLRRRPGPAKCRTCGKQLSGVPRLRDSDIKSLSRTERKPERPYGGNLCSSCTKDLMKRKNMLRWENV